jgi:hypothetical protein
MLESYRASAVLSHCRAVPPRNLTSLMLYGALSRLNEGVRDLDAFNTCMFFYWTLEVVLSLAIFGVFRWAGGGGDQTVSIDHSLYSTPP